MSDIILSKSKFTQGLQCLKLLWLSHHDSDRLEPFSEFTEHILKEGQRFGQLAQELFPGGTEIPFDRANRKERVRMTRDLIKKGADVIYEASFLHNNFIVMVDILKKDDNGKWEIYEVKSKTHVEDYLIPDAAVQTYMLTQCGLEVSHTYFITPSNEYVLDGELDLGAFLNITNVDTQVNAWQDRIPELIIEMWDTLGQEAEPDIGIGLHCNDPYDCPAQSYCWQHIPEYSLFDIYRISKKTVFSKYYPDIIAQKDIPDIDAFTSSENRRIEIKTNVDQGVYVDRPALQEWLSSIRYPVYHLDFETYAPIIPRYQGHKAFSMVTFQYSLHIHQEDGTYEHREYIAPAGQDPRRFIAENLAENIPQGVQLMAYHMSFEQKRIEELVAMFPDLAVHLQSLIDNMLDLETPFLQRWAYHWKQKGKTSIKKVMPAWVPEMETSYHDLDLIHGGTDASTQYLRLETETDQQEKSRITRALLKYCELDTLSMVKVLEALKKQAS